jgi:pentatricopeptide repeat protein
VFNQQIAVHANRKELSKAKEIFEQVKQYKIENKHTYAAMINVAIRCGLIDYAEELFQEIKSMKYNYKDVVLYTTLMKGYCLYHMMLKAENLFDELISHYKNALNRSTSSIQEKNTEDQHAKNSKDSNITSLIPNVRTINTLLRGCIQNGNLIIAEKFLLLFQKDFNQMIDINTWEYLVILYSQNLMIPKIFPILGRLKKDFQSAKDEGTTYSFLSMHMFLLKSLFLLQEKKSIQKYLPVMKELLQQYEASKSTAEEESQQQQQNEMIGGKRGWKQSQKQSNPSTTTEEVVPHPSNNNDDDNDYILQRREESLVVYRQHLFEEWKYEVQLMDQFLPFLTANNNQMASSHFNYLISYYFHLFAFDMEVIHLIPENMKRTNENNYYFIFHLLINLISKFGLFHLIQHFHSSLSLPLVEKLFYFEFHSYFPQLKEFFLAKYLETQENKTTDKPENESKSTEINNNNNSNKKNDKNQKNQKKAVSTTLPESEKLLFQGADKLFSAAIMKELKKEEKSLPAVLIVQEFFRKLIQSFQRYFQSNSKGMFNFQEIFSSLFTRANDDETSSASSAKNVKLNLEICSGNGDWANVQSKNDPENAWITVELRSDRVFHTFYRSFITSNPNTSNQQQHSSNNLLTIQSNACYILPNHFPSDSMHHIFINHPEPPQQTSSRQSSDADHLLNAVSPIISIVFLLLLFLTLESVRVSSWSWKELSIQQEE